MNYCKFNVIKSNNFKLKILFILKIKNYLIKGTNGLKFSGCHFLSTARYAREGEGRRNTQLNSKNRDPNPAAACERRQSVTSIGVN